MVANYTVEPHISKPQLTSCSDDLALVAECNKMATVNKADSLSVPMRQKHVVLTHENKLQFPVRPYWTDGKLEQPKKTCV
jgi:hypothetical protein